MHRPLRALFVTSDASSVSGVGRCIGDLITHLDRRVIDPILVTAWPSAKESTIIEEVKASGAQIYHRDLGIWYPPKSRWGGKHLANLLRNLRARTWALAHLIREHRIDLVYTNALPSPDAAITAKQLGLPHIWHLHEAVCGNTYLRPYVPCTLAKGLIRRLSRRVITVSQARAVDFAGAAFEQVGVRVVHNGVNLARFTTARKRPDSLLSSLGLPAHTQLVALVGIVSAHKGHDTLMRAAAQVLQVRPDTAFLLAGPELGDFGKDLRDLISELGIAHRVFFLGPRDDVPDLLSGIDLLVLPSVQEALPLVLLEAMASSKPVVATRCGGPVEIVVDGETGYLVDVGDDIAMANRILLLLQNPMVADRMGRAGRRHAETHFSLATYARNIEKVICEVYASSTSDPG